MKSKRTPTEIASIRMNNAAGASVSVRTVESGDIVELCRRLRAIGLVLQREDLGSTLIRRRMWKLKHSALLTLLPFDAEDIDLAGLAKGIRTDRDLPSECIADAEGAVAAASALTAARHNPKSDMVNGILRDAASGDKEALVVTRLTESAATPGWPERIFQQVHREHHGVATVRSCRELRDLAADIAIVPSGGGSVPDDMMSELLYGGVVKDVVLVTYPAEYRHIPPRITLSGGRRALAARQSRVVVPPGPEWTEPITSEQLGYWDRVREAASREANADTDSIVVGRWMLLASGEVVCLPDEGEILEVSDLVEHHVGGGAGGVPRKSVQDLAEGDVIVLRLSGSGDALEVIADSMMREDGCPELRTQAGEWREPLRLAIQRSGYETIKRDLAKLGFTFQSGASYLRAYVRGHVIAPGTQQRFETLVKVLVDHGALEGGDAPRYAAEHWALIQRLKSYQRRAGNEIRHRLLAHLQSKLAGEGVNLSEPIVLPGMDSGELGLRRIAAIDKTPSHVSPSRLFRLEHNLDNLLE